MRRLGRERERESVIYSECWEGRRKEAPPLPLAFRAAPIFLVFFFFSFEALHMIVGDYFICSNVKRKKSTAEKSKKIIYKPLYRIDLEWLVNHCLRVFRGYFLRLTLKYKFARSQECVAKRSFF